MIIPRPVIPGIKIVTIICGTRYLGRTAAVFRSDCKRTLRIYFPKDISPCSRVLHAEHNNFVIFECDGEGFFCIERFEGNDSVVVAFLDELDEFVVGEDGLLDVCGVAIDAEFCKEFGEHDLAAALEVVLGLGSVLCGEIEVNRVGAYRA